MTDPVFQGVTPALAHLGVIQAEGPEAAAFLHGQLTQDFVLMKPEQARLAALCTAKGRMIASFIGIRPTPERVLLLCSQDILAATLKRLSMFVLRAKLKLSDVSADWHVHGLAGAALAANGLDAQAEPWRCQSVGEAFGISLYPADGQPRALWLAPAASPPPVGDALPEAGWAWQEVRSGVATLSAPVVDAFVPQMLNYESVDGVNFKKGCYPGQEIVARSQFRGTLKRRAYLVSADAPLQPGQEVFAASDAEQPVGTVVQSAASGQGPWAALVSMQIAALQAGALHAGSVSGPQLQVQPLPYALREDI
ncbi:folate-binding protein [Xenophilus arseniciresistens]|uniref:Folate-binding protein n=1 Tax=Xenophilus arseniciresistens TaxID=1283306 RepID=A0AAE3NAT8_9BURK|nr:folate-binding protein [Xenophilus arseniciresistens]MDA7417953.1 folate-binding protein [Xenophilus arseniciresistens]